MNSPVRTILLVLMLVGVLIAIYVLLPMRVRSIRPARTSTIEFSETEAPPATSPVAAESIVQRPDQPTPQALDTLQPDRSPTSTPARRLTEQELEALKLQDYHAYVRYKAALQKAERDDSRRLIDSKTRSPDELTDAVTQHLAEHLRTGKPSR